MSIVTGTLAHTETMAAAGIIPHPGITCPEIGSPQGSSQFYFLVLKPTYRDSTVDIREVVTLNQQIFSPFLQTQEVLNTYRNDIISSRYFA